METKPKYNLESRTQRFSLAVIELCRSVKFDSITKPLVSQLIRSASSIGANYREANNASSRRDFGYKISLCKKEAAETEYWLSMLASSSAGSYDRCNELKSECHEMVLVFQKISSATKVPVRKLEIGK